MRRLSRAIPAINLGRCTGCGWCVGVCPPHVLSLHGGKDGKVSVLDDADACTGCALCYVRCPFDAIRMVRRGSAATGSPASVSQEHHPA